MGWQRGTTHLQPSVCLDEYVYIHFWFYLRITMKLRKEKTRQSASNEWKGMKIYLVSFDLKYYNYIICWQSIVFLPYLVFVVAIPTWSMTLCRNCLSQFSSSFSIPSPAILHAVSPLHKTCPFAYLAYKPKLWEKLFTYSVPLSCFRIRCQQRYFPIDLKFQPIFEWLKIFLIILRYRINNIGYKT